MKWKLLNIFYEAKGEKMAQVKPKSVKELLLQKLKDYKNQIVDNKLRGIAYKLDLKSPTSLMLADHFYLLDKDIIFVSTYKITRWNQTMSRMLSSLDFINLWKTYKPINSEVFRTQ